MVSGAVCENYDKVSFGEEVLVKLKRVDDEDTGNQKKEKTPKRQKKPKKAVLDFKTMEFTGAKDEPGSPRLQAKSTPKAISSIPKKAAWGMVDQNIPLDPMEHVIEFPALAVSQDPSATRIAADTNGAQDACTTAFQDNVTCKEDKKQSAGLPDDAASEHDSEDRSTTDLGVSIRSSESVTADEIELPVTSRLQANYRLRNNRMILPPPLEPAPPLVPQGWRCIWSKNNEAYFFLHISSNISTWDAPVVIDTCEEPEDIVPVVSGTLEVTDHIGPGEYLCSKHWYPEAENCVRVFHGERLVVTWTDGSPGGWAYGHALDDESKAGYFPQFLLSVPERPPQHRRCGERCAVAQRFDGPEEVGGYLSVEPGLIVEVLHEVEAPYVWVYARISQTIGEDGLASAPGWLPEAVLTEVSQM